MRTLFFLLLVATPREWEKTPEDASISMISDAAAKKLRRSRPVQWSEPPMPF